MSLKRFVQIKISKVVKLFVFYHLLTYNIVLLFLLITKRKENLGNGRQCSQMLKKKIFRKLSKVTSIKRMSFTLLFESIK